MIYILFIIGFPLLLKGADFLVEGAESIARKFGWSDVLIGLTIVSIGTSMPELMVNIMAQIQGNGATDIAIGNILGSNIANILLILGATLMVAKITVPKDTLFKEMPFSVLGAVLLLFLTLDGGKLNGLDAFILLSLFAIFTVYIIHLALTHPKDFPADEADHHFSLPQASIYIIIGLIGLQYGGKFIVEGAIAISQQLGLSTSFIGLTVVAIGTSLPELAASVVAAKRGNTGMAIGNVVGSNIFNIFWVLGISSAIGPLYFWEDSIKDVIFLVGASLLLFAFAFYDSERKGVFGWLGERYVIRKYQGIIFLCLYFGYLTYLVMNTIW